MATGIKVTDLPAKAAAAITANDQVMLFNTTETTQTPFDEAVPQAMTLAGCYCLQSVTLTVPSAQVLTLYTTPVFFGIVVPAGLYINILSATFNATYNGVAYTGGDIIIAQQGANFPLGTGSYLSFAANTFIPFTLDAPVVDQRRFDDGGDLFLSATSAVLTGNSEINVTVNFILLPTPL